MESGRPVVFLGPSLSLPEARAILDADYRPPARKGDVYRCLASGVGVIALIDGVFHTEPSVWPRELLEALDEGVLVFGASSMGALRAVELGPYGMIGFGTVFEWYRDGVIDGDDEVALLFDVTESGYRALSEPLVNIRATLARAIDEGILEPVEVERLLDHAKRRFYPDLSFEDLLACPAVAGWPAGTRRSLEALFRSWTVDVKRLDAVGLLHRLSRLAGTAPAARRDSRPVWLERYRFRDFSGAEGRLSGSQWMNAVLDEPESQGALVALLRRRWFLAAWAEERGHRCPPEALAAFAERFEARAGIGDRPAWLVDRSLTETEYLRWLDEVALADWLRSAGAARFGLADGGRDSDAPFIADWAAAAGISCPGGGELVEWLVEQGPPRFGFADDLLPRLVCEIRIAAGWNERSAGEEGA